MSLPSPALADDDALLQVQELGLAFGGVQALSAVGFTVRPGEIRGIIGPNGAGKSSLLNCLNGVYTPQHGRIVIGDQVFGAGAARLTPGRVAKLGLARTFQNLALFKGMSVLDNILCGRSRHMKVPLLLQALHWGPAQREELAHRAVAERLIDFLEIQAHRKTPVGQLPYGLQKRVDLARALAMEPRLLLLDEPMAGMNLEEKQDMCRFMLDIHDEFGTAIVLIEHDMGVVMDLCDRIVVLDHGQKIADGTPAQVRSDPAVVQAYLGQAR